MNRSTSSSSPPSENSGGAGVPSAADSTAGPQDPEWLEDLRGAIRQEMDQKLQDAGVESHNVYCRMIREDVRLRLLDVLKLLGRNEDDLGEKRLHAVEDSLKQCFVESQRRLQEVTTLIQKDRQDRELFWREIQRLSANVGAPSADQQLSQPPIPMAAVENQVLAEATRGQAALDLEGIQAMGRNSTDMPAIRLPTAPQTPTPATPQSMHQQISPPQAQQQIPIPTVPHVPHALGSQPSLSALASSAGHTLEESLLYAAELEDTFPLVPRNPWAPSQMGVYGSPSSPPFRMASPSDSLMETSPVPGSAPAPRKRGRPRKHPLPKPPNPLEPPKKRGRPRKHPLPVVPLSPVGL